jgi:predicted phage terminase large subunit-like protein
LAPDKQAVGELMTTARGGRLATSVGGTLTGRGGQFLLIDDPHKAEEASSDAARQAVIDWYRTTLLSRLDDPQNGAIVLVQQRLHENDLAGHLLASAAGTDGGWTHLNLPAIAETPERVPLEAGGVHRREPGDLLQPERQPRALLDRLLREMGSYAFAAQYQQRPAPLGGGLVQWKWFQRYRNPPPKGPGGQVVQSWDTALKAGTAHDWSVCTTWLRQDHRSWLLDLVRERLEFPDLKGRVAQEARRHQADLVLIEDQGAGTALIQDLARDSAPPRAGCPPLCVVGVTPTADKATRLLAVSPLIEAGRVLLPEDAHWLAAFHHELATFPNGRHDDQVDSLSQYLSWERERPVFTAASFLTTPSFFARDLLDWDDAPE